MRPLIEKQYKTERLKNLFVDPYNKKEYMERDMVIERRNASKYLNMIVNEGLLKKEKIGNVNYYINVGLINLFVNHTKLSNDTPVIESVHNT